jgi:hypothetical protein
MQVESTHHIKMHMVSTAYRLRRLIRPLNVLLLSDDIEPWMDRVLPEYIAGVFGVCPHLHGEILGSSKVELNAKSITLYVRI